MGTFRTLQKHWENIEKFGSCPLRCKTLVFPGFFAFLANCFGFPARPCTCMLALPCPLVSRPVSRQSRLKTLVFTGKTVGFAAEELGFELGARCFEKWMC